MDTEMPPPPTPDNRKKRLLALAGACGLILVLVFASILIFSKEKVPTNDELRIQHADYLVKLLEAYKKKYGAYPQPTVREETPAGMRHVWGYEKDVPALASCIVADPANSVCGGNVYDINGNVVGWKGTITPDSGLNNIEVAHLENGRIDSPISEAVSSLPSDPAFSEYENGFGEYIYAVRVPDDGARNKGGAEFQIAFTSKDHATGLDQTHILGNYYVKSDEKDVMPPSLIGSGILFDENANPVKGQTRPIHVLMDGQKNGYPNPVLGNGKEVIDFIRLQKKAERLGAAVDDRIKIVSEFPRDNSTSSFLEELNTIKSSVDAFAASLESKYQQASMNTDDLNSSLLSIVASLSKAGDKFIDARYADVKDVLDIEIASSDVAKDIVKNALDGLIGIEDDILQARDELLRYIDGAGIEDQSRMRAGRHLENAVDAVPDIYGDFAKKGISLPKIFISTDEQNMLNRMAASEGREAEGGAALPDSTEHYVMVLSMVFELSANIDDLSSLLVKAVDELKNPAITIENIDESLRKMAKALSKEDIRLTEMFNKIVGESVAKNMLADYESESASLGKAYAIGSVAKKIGLNGNFTPLQFTQNIFESIEPDRGAGLPFAGEYTGIPYPVP